MDATYCAVLAVLKSKQTTAAHYGMVDDEHDHRADDSNEDAVEVQTCNRSGAEGREQIATHDRPDDAEYEIENEPLTRFVDDLACDETGDETQNEPCNN